MTRPSQRRPARPPARLVAGPPARSATGTYLQHTLGNGVRIVGEVIDTVPSVSIGFFFHAGVVYENQRVLGVSHVIEHMLFKGTPTRTARDIARSFDRIGGILNAFTAKDYCCFYGRVVAEHLPVAVEVLADMVSRSLIDPEELARERNVILEEIKMYEDSPDELIHENLVRTLWPRATLGHPILGTERSIKGLRREDIVAMFRRHFVAGNLLVAVAGRFDFDRLIALLERHLVDLPEGSVTPRRCRPEPQAAFSCAHKEIEQVHLALGTTGYSQHDPRRHALTLLNSAFGGGMSSRLFQEIREMRGLAYSVYSYHSSFRDTGLFGIYVGTSLANLEAVLDRLVKELARARRGGITATELREAKEQMRGNLLIALESTTNRMNRLATRFLYGVPLLTPEEAVAPLLEVTRQQVAEVAREVLDETRMAISLLSPPGPIPEILAASPFSSRPRFKL